MIKRFHFLSGLPRSGSNLLGTLLNQHSQLWVSSNSALHDAMRNLRETFINSEQIQLNLKPSFAQEALWSFPNLFYRRVTEPVVLDKNPLWATPEGFALASKFSICPKFIVLHRPIIEVLASYVSVAEEKLDFYINAEYDKKNSGLNTNLSRNDQLGKFMLTKLEQPYLGYLYARKNSGEQFMTIDYSDLVHSPKEVVENIFNFLNLENEEIMYTNLPNIYRWSQKFLFGVDDFLMVRPEIQKKSPDPNALFSPFMFDQVEEFMAKVNTKLGKD